MVLEYVILLSIAFTLSIILMKTLVGDTQGSGVKSMWAALLQAIGSDTPN